MGGRLVLLNTFLTQGIFKLSWAYWNVTMS